MNSAIERLLTLKIRDVMTRQVVHVSPSQTLIEAAQKLQQHGVSAAPVVDDRGICVGMLSATDYLGPVGAGAESSPEALAGCCVSDCMAQAVTSTGADVGLISAARQMCLAHIHRLPVLDAEKRVIGMVSSLDIAAAVVAAIEE